MTDFRDKFRLTLPERWVERYGIKVGDRVELVAIDDKVVLVPARTFRESLTTEERLRNFDCATRRHNGRAQEVLPHSSATRDWNRESLYTRGRAR